MSVTETELWRTDPQAAFEEATSRVERAAGLLGGDSLDLSDLHALKALPRLSQLPNLRDLSIGHTQIENISGIVDAPYLERLVLDSAPVADLGPIATLANLRRLDLDNTKVDDLAPVASCLGLQDLSLMATHVTDLTPLSGLTSLQSLTVWESAVTDLTPIGNLPALRWLDIDSCAVRDTQPIRKLSSLRSLYASYTGLTDFDWLSSLDGLTNLSLNGNDISSVDFIKSLRLLESLSLIGTRVRDLTPLADCKNLDRLSLIATPIEDLTPLRSLRLRQLDISRTKVSNLLPLVRMTSLASGAKSNARAGLTFADCPLGDPTLVRFSKLQDPDRTIGTLNYLREKVGLPPIDGTDQEASLQDAALEELFGKLQQDRLGARSIRVGNQFVIAPSGDEQDAAILNDPIARQLHSEASRKAPALSAFANRIKNQPGWTDFAAATAAFQKVVSLPLEEITERPAELWSLCASLGAYAEQDDQARTNAHSFIMPLDADGRRMLTDVVATAAVLARRFHSVRVLDEELRQFMSLPEPVEAAAKLVLTAAQQRVLSQESADILIVELSSPLIEDVQSKKAHGRGLLSARNLALAAVGAILTGYLGEFGVEVAKEDILVQRAKSWVVAKEQELLKAFEGAPGDTKTAIQEALRRAAPREGAAIVGEKKIKE